MARKPYPIAFSDDERAAIWQDAKELGLGFSAYIRRVLMQAHRRKRRPPVEPAIEFEDGELLELGADDGNN